MAGQNAVEAGGAALRAGRWEDARAAFEEALAEGDSPEALSGLADALWWLGDVRAAVHHRERAYSACRRAGDVAGAVAAAIKLSIDYDSSLGNPAAAGGWVARAERLADDAGDDLSPLRGHVWLARCHHTDDLDLAVHLAEQALDLARDVGDVDMELTALGQLGRALVEAGRTGEGMALLDEAMAGTLGGECEDLATTVYSSCAMLTACDVAADLERAVQWCRAADAFTRAYGCPFLYAECRLLYGGVLLGSGEWVEAEAELEAAARAAGDAYPAIRDGALVKLAELRLRQGRLDDADALVAEVADPRVTALPAAGVRLARGEPTVAAALCERHLEVCGDRHVDTARALALVVEARLAAGDVAAAGVAAERLAHLAAAQPDDRVRAEAALATGRVLRGRQEGDGAPGELGRALELFSRMELPWEAASARVELARALAGSRPDVAAVEAQAALTAFERLGAVGGADAAAALLRSLGVTGRPAPRGAGDLTRREKQVLELVSHGLTNPEIAQRLYISPKTASHHVSNVLAKLGVRNRSEAAAYAVRHAEVTRRSQSRQPTGRA